MITRTQQHHLSSFWREMKIALFTITFFVVFGVGLSLLLHFLTVS